MPHALSQDGDLIVILVAVLSLWASGAAMTFSSVPPRINHFQHANRKCELVI